MRVKVVASVLACFAATAYAAQPGSVSRGRDLFVQTWVPFDTRAAPGGDGLGPMYNATSCVACHSQGGVGGAGNKDRNVRLVKLADKPNFVVDHRATTLTAKPLPPTNGTRVERNTPALFGVGLVDRIDDKALEDLAATQTGDVSGRVARTADGRIGRFGWKGHTASLTEFVQTACANELGLAVDGHPQGQPPPGDLAERLSLMEQAISRYGKSVQLLQGPERDLVERDVDSLTAFVSALPHPKELTEQPGAASGKQVFADIGCASCHVESVANVKGMYADLLLHDMGGALSDAAGSYETRGNEKMVASAGDPALAPAAQGEWRTPPLWGVRDSAPYMHDGRAPTLDEAIRLHGGEASKSSARYNELPLTKQQELASFLESLVVDG